MSVYAASSSAEKAIALLLAFSSGPGVMGVSQLARRTGLPKSTAFRLLGVLVDSGLLSRSGSRYRLGPSLSELRPCVEEGDSDTVREAAIPFVHDLHQATGQTVELAVARDRTATIAYQLYGHKRVRTPRSIGGHLGPAHGALSKSILAFSDPRRQHLALRCLAPATPYTIVSPTAFMKELKEIRRVGVAFEREELSLGVVGVACPILSDRGDVLGAVSVSGAAGRFDPSMKAPLVREVARRIASAVRASNMNRVANVRYAVIPDGGAPPLGESA